MDKTASIEILKQSENKYTVKVQGVKVAVFFKYENAIEYEKELRELNPYIKLINKATGD